jgi:hypothetical protein
MGTWGHVGARRGTLQKDLCKFMVIFSWIILVMRNTADHPSRKDQNTHFILNNFFRKSCLSR